MCRRRTFSEGRKWGVRSVVVEFGVFGAPRFSIQRSQNPLKIGIWGPLDWKSGSPKNAKSYHDGSDPPFAALWSFRQLDIVMVGKRSSIIFLFLGLFRSLLGHFFLMLLSLFSPLLLPDPFCRTPFAAGWLLRDVSGDFSYRVSFWNSTQGRANHEVLTVNWTLEFSRLKVPASRFALHGLAPPKFTVCGPFFPLIHGIVRLFQAALDTPLDSPFSATLSVHGLHFTVCGPSIQHFSEQFIFLQRCHPKIEWWRTDCKHWHCTGKRLLRTIRSFFNKVWYPSSRTKKGVHKRGIHESEFYEDQNLTPTPNPRFPCWGFSVCDQVSDGNSY